ncbi:MAG: hypothetical protein AAF998_07480 [Bacteroidota bacterium]
MFRLQLHSLWSQDYVVPLARMLAIVMDCSLEAATAHVAGLASQTKLVLDAPTPSEANFLARDLLQFGVFVEVEQIGPVTEEAMRYDAIKSLPKSMTGWYVHVDERHGKVVQLIERDSLTILRYEMGQITLDLGEEMLRRGAIPIDAERMSELDKLMDNLRPSYVTWEKEYMAERIRLIKAQRKRDAVAWPAPSSEEE